MPDDLVSIKAHPDSWVPFIALQGGTALTPGQWPASIYAGRLDSRSDHRLTLNQLPRVPEAQ